MKSNFIRNINDEYALVTGGTTGLGFLYVLELINIGYNVIIASPHDGQKNHELEKLAKSANKKIICLKKDLCTLGNCEFVYNECIKYNIILVINNSGIGTWGPSLKSSFEEEMEVVNLNIRALHYFTKKFTIYFNKKGLGKIINIGSIASFVPGPLFANYYASKAYVLSYSSAFNSELKYSKSLVRIVTICPGFLKTSFFAHSNKNNGSNPFLPSVKPKTFARKSLHRALTTKNKNYILVGVFTKVSWFLNILVPKRIILKIIYKWQTKRDGSN